MYIIYQENGDYLKKKLCIHFFVAGRATNSHLYKLKANKKERKKKTTAAQTLGDLYLYFIFLPLLRP